MVLIRMAHDLKSDLPRIRSLCSQWPPCFPLSIVQDLHVPVKPPPLHPNTHLFIPETHFLLLSPLNSDPPGSLGGNWLARVFPVRSDVCKLLNPLNVDDYFSADPPVAGFVDHLDTHVLELSRTFFLLEDDEKKAEPISQKVVGGWNLDSDYLFGVLALLKGERGGGLWVWRLKDEEWIQIEGTGLNGELGIADIVYHDEKFYAFELSSWRIGVIDPKNESVAMEFIAAPEIETDPSGEEYILNLDGRLHYLGGVYLVPTNAQLYLVIEVLPKSEGDDDGEAKYTMIVFVMKQQSEGGEEEGQSQVWERVKNIGDQIFFIGYDTCFALPSASVNLPQWKPGSICLFTRPFPQLYDGFFSPWGASQRIPKGLECLRRFDYATYWRYYRLFEMGEDEEEKSVVPFKNLPLDVYTGLFFPPPAWVKWRCPDLDDAEISFENVTFSEFDPQ